MSNLYDTLAGNLAGIAQYNGDNRQFEGLSLNMTLKSVCAIMDDESLGTPVKRYSLVNNKLLEKYNKKCLDYKYDKLIAYLSQTEWDSEAGETGGNILFSHFSFSDGTVCIYFNLYIHACI